METQEYGLILRRFLPSQHKLTVLTPTMGKINLITKKPQLCLRLWPGMVVAFIPQFTGRPAYVCDDVEIITTPQPETKEDMYWVHHLLELCYHFIPHESPNGDLFQSVLSYLTILKHKEFFQYAINGVKAMCIAHFLQETGLYAQSALIQYQPALITLSALIYDEASREQNMQHFMKQAYALTCHDVEKIQKYIFDCVKDHPSFNLFKTMRFVYPS